MNREDALLRIEQAVTRWDVVVIGGGATGLGVAVDAASRGYRTLLLEQADFAQATSSRSTKLIHGGFRYLKQGNLPLVRESLRERGRLLRNAPHLVRPLPFLLPLYQFWERPYYEAGLRLYDWLAGSLGLEPCRFLEPEDSLKTIPTLQPKELWGSLRYFDAQFDDARLAISLLRTLQAHGGTAANYMRVHRLLHYQGHLRGVVAQDLESGREFHIMARVIINAAGIFTDAVRQLDTPHTPPILAVSQGAHIVLDASFLPGDHALMIPKTHDGRVLFAIPWLGKVLVGTTDLPRDNPVLEPVPLEEEIQFLLEHAAHYLTRTPTHQDILSCFAGLRPLVRAQPGTATSKLSRSHLITVSTTGLITITGGKWTTYRQMAEDTMDRAAALANLNRLPCRTADLRLLDEDEPGRTSLAREQPALADPLHPRLPYRKVDVVWAARHEMARSAEDVLSRRTRALILDARAALEAAPTVADLLRLELERDEAWGREQVRSFRSLADNYLP